MWQKGRHQNQFTLGLIAVALTFTLLLLWNDTNPISIHFYEWMDTFQDTTGTMNGFFASSIDDEACIEFKQDISKWFQSVRMTDVASTIFQSISGQFIDSQSGSVSIKINSNHTNRNYTRFTLAVDPITNKEVFTMIDVNTNPPTSRKLIRARRSKCGFTTNHIICASRLNIEKESDATFLASNKVNLLGQMLEGVWKTRTGNGMVFGKHGGGPTYNYKVTGFLSGMTKNGQLYVTKMSGDGMYVGFVRNFLSAGGVFDQRWHLDPKLRSIHFLNCDETPTGVFASKKVPSQTTDDKQDL